MLEAIGFDGDDTLWDGEVAFLLTQERVRSLLAPYVDPATLDRQLLEVEKANLHLYGYGAKSFTLSLIETALELAGNALTAADVRTLLNAGKDLLAHPIELVPDAREVVAAVAAYGLPVLLITKGDLFHQESKVARSGLGDLMDSIEVVHEKDEASYRRVLRRHAIAPNRFLMVGNSLRSDALPVLALGGWAAHVAHELTWAFERLEDDSALKQAPRFRALRSLTQVPELIAELTGGQQDLPPVDTHRTWDDSTPSVEPPTQTAQRQP